MKGFTLMELLAAIAIVGVLSTAAVIMLGRTHVQTLQGKLESDVASLNRAVAVYVGFGGDLTAVEEPAEVLRRLKTRQSAVEAKSATGLTGQFLDSRWEADLMSEEEASSDRPRVVWDP
ncbi:MAG: type II secretion system protein, partial [Verrucomicrobiales bacterium]